jgi:hypothetical protein
MTRSKWLLGVVAILLAAACDAQMAPGYEGEALVSLSGTVSSTEEISDRMLAELEWQLEWVDFMASEPEYVQSSLGSEGEFPNRYSLEVRNRPPDRLLNDFSQISLATGESRIGMALIQARSWFSYARQVLVYVDEDIRSDTVGAIFAGGRLRAGFHLLEVVDAPCNSYLPDDDPAEGSIDCLRPAADDLDTIIDLHIVPFGDEGFPPEYPRLYKNSCKRFPDPCDD